MTHTICPLLPLPSTPLALALVPHFTRLLSHTPYTDPERGKGSPLQTLLPSPFLVYKAFLSAISITSSEEGRAVGMIPTLDPRKGSTERLSN